MRKSRESMVDLSLYGDKRMIERIYYVLKEQGFIKSQFSDFMDAVDSDGIVRVLNALSWNRLIQDVSY